jgi:hypothetical protein
MFSKLEPLLSGWAVKPYFTASNKRLIQHLRISNTIYIKVLFLINKINISTKETLFIPLIYPYLTHCRNPPNTVVGIHHMSLPKAILKVVLTPSYCCFKGESTFSTPREALRF